jgi:hypothetical protein
MTKPDDSEPPIKLLRTAKGKRPQYFSDPDVDRLLGIIVPLIAEVSVLRERLDTVERLAERGGLFKQDDVETYIPDDKAQACRDTWREHYLDRVFRITQSELEETTGGRGVDLEKIIEDFAEGRI